MNGAPPPTGARHARPHPAVFRATNSAVLYSDRHGRHGKALRARRRRSRHCPRPAACQQPTRFRHPALCPPPSRARAGPNRVAAFADARFRRAADRCRSGAVRRIRPPGGDAPRAFARTPKIPGPPKLRSRRMACVPSDQHGCRLGHGSRRAHRPGDARPSPREQHPSAFGDGVGANRAGRPCPGTQENLRGTRGRDDRRRAGQAGGFAGGRSGPAPVALRLAARLLGVARALEHRRTVGSPRIRTRAWHRPGTRRTHPYHPPRALDRRRCDHDCPPHRRTRTGAEDGDSRRPGREPRNSADGRNARHVREIHGDAVQPGTQPRREAFPGDPARRRQSSGPIPPHHRRPTAGEGRRRRRRRRRRARDRHGTT
jgi:hypothetical protein